MHKITCIPGDGIGPEIMDAAKRVINATGLEIEWETQYAGEYALQNFGSPLPKETIASIKKNKIALKGPLTTPIGKGFRSINVQLRKLFDLYAGVRPCKLYKGVLTRFEKVDIVIFRENTEGLYTGIEFSVSQDLAIAIKTISRHASERIAKAAFSYAQKYKRKKVTAVHKANIQKFTDGLFLETARSVAQEYPEIEFDDILVDNACLQLVKNPERFDVLLLPNLYGDILSDLCSGLVGGLGMVPSANLGDGIAIFEATHGSAPKYAGKNKANPTALMLSAVMMLRYIGENEAAHRIEDAIARTIAEGKNVTYDLKMPEHMHEAVGTKEYADAVISNMG